MVTINATTRRAMMTLNIQGVFLWGISTRIQGRRTPAKNTKKDLNFCARIILLGDKPEPDGIGENK
jgi:hypothetical protein